MSTEKEWVRYWEPICAAMHFVIRPRVLRTEGEPFTKGFCGSDSSSESTFGCAALDSACCTKGSLSGDLLKSTKNSAVAISIPVRRSCSLRYTVQPGPREELRSVLALSGLVEELEVEQLNTDFPC